MSAPQHLPDRPGWGCLACEKPWPYSTARNALSEESGGTTLAVTMSVYLAEAAGDLPESTPADLYERFLVWTWQG